MRPINSARRVCAPATHGLLPHTPRGSAPGIAPTHAEDDRASTRPATPQVAHTHRNALAGGQALRVSTTAVLPRPLRCGAARGSLPTQHAQRKHRTQAPLLAAEREPHARWKCSVLATSLAALLPLAVEPGATLLVPAANFFSVSTAMPCRRACKSPQSSGEVCGLVEPSGGCAPWTAKSHQVVPLARVLPNPSAHAPRSLLPRPLPPRPWASSSSGPPAPSPARRRLASTWRSSVCACADATACYRMSASPGRELWMTLTLSPSCGALRCRTSSSTEQAMIGSGLELRPTHEHCSGVWSQESTSTAGRARAAHALRPSALLAVPTLAARSHTPRPGASPPPTHTHAPPTAGGLPQRSTNQAPHAAGVGHGPQ